MPHSFFCTIAVAAVALAAGRATAGPITYSIDNYPDLQNGATLTGSITTDGHLGDLSFTDLVSWQLTISGIASGPLSSSSSDAHPQFEFKGTLMATADAITLGGGPLNALLLGSSNGGNDFVNVNWFRDANASGYRAELGQDSLWNSFYEGAPTFSLGGDPWIIAEVEPSTSTPEPTTITLVGIGMAGVVVHRWRRRRTESRCEPAP